MVELVLVQLLASMVIFALPFRRLAGVLEPNLADVV